jgi:hypothetical protein
MELTNNELLKAIKEIINQSRLKVFRAANSALLDPTGKSGNLLLKMNYRESSVQIMEKQP